MTWWDRVKAWAKILVSNPKGGPDPELLVRLDTGLPANCQVLAFGHFTPERNLDVFVLDETRSRLHVYLYDRSNQ